MLKTIEMLIRLDFLYTQDFGWFVSCQIPCKKFQRPRFGSWVWSFASRSKGGLFIATQLLHANLLAARNGCHRRSPSTSPLSGTSATTTGSCARSLKDFETLCLWLLPREALQSDAVWLSPVLREDGKSSVPT